MNSGENVIFDLLLRVCQNCAIIMTKKIFYTLAHTVYVHEIYTISDSILTVSFWVSQSSINFIGNVKGRLKTAKRYKQQKKLLNTI